MDWKKSAYLTLYSPYTISWIHLGTEKYWQDVDHLINSALMAEWVWIVSKRLDNVVVYFFPRWNASFIYLIEGILGILIDSCSKKYNLNYECVLMTFKGQESLLQPKSRWSIKCSLTHHVLIDYTSHYFSSSNSFQRLSLRSLLYCWLHLLKKEFFGDQRK